MFLCKKLQMDYVFVGFASLIGAILTLFSGFGLGTLLLPVFGLFFPVEIAIIMTSIVHFSNNFLKVLLFGKSANKTIIIKFGIPAMVFALLGSYCLNFLMNAPILFEYHFLEKQFTVSILKICVGVLLLFFGLVEFNSKFKNKEFDKKYLSLGGILSGFFGGISGHQGALRSAFLIKTGISKQSFIATGVVIACLVDISRLSVYIPKIINNNIQLNYKLVIVGVISAFVGVYFGNKLLQKTTMKSLQNLVAILLFVYGILLIFGLI